MSSVRALAPARRPQLHRQPQHGLPRDRVAISRLDRTDRRPDLVLYRINHAGNEHLLYPDEIAERFGISADALPKSTSRESVLQLEP